MGRWIETLRTATRPPLWLDDTTYASRLFAGDAPPWLDAAALAGWRRKALLLLNPDVAVLDVRGLARAWPDKGTTLLNDRGFIAHLTDVTRVLRASTDKPFALDLPAPATWLKMAQGSLTGEGNLDEDEIDAVAGDMARLLRAQSEAGIDAVLLREEVLDPEQLASRIGCYTSLTNTAHHYRWDIGIHTPGGVPITLGSFDFAIACRGATGVELGIEFWNGADAPAIDGDGFYFATIPANAQPAQVLARVNSLS